MPLDLVRAIAHANKILDWHENLKTEDIPPEWMWPFDKELKEWFDEIKREQANPEPANADTTVPMMQNELARGRGRR